MRFAPRSDSRQNRLLKAALGLLFLFTVIAVAGYATFALNPHLLGRFPGAASFYAVSFVFFGRTHVLLSVGVLLLYLAVNSGHRWLPAFAAVYLASLMSELAGTNIGFPFGAYSYTHLLGYRWFGDVPWLIPLSWYAMAVPSYVLARQAFPERRAAHLGFAAILLVIWDLALDPAMSFLTPYWVWEQPGIYYGMPMLNLFGWLLTAVLLMFLLFRLGAERWAASLSPGWMAAYYLITLLMPLGMIIAAGLWGAVVATLLAGGLAGWIIFRRWKAAGPSNGTTSRTAESPAANASGEAYFRHHSRTFSFAARWFRADDRRVLTCLYLFCRTVDDLVDDEHVEDRAAVAERLDQWLARARRSYEGGSTEIEWMDTLMRASAACGMPFRIVEDLVEGVRLDNRAVRIRTWEELNTYAYLVASTVGIWMCYLFGKTDAETLHRAAALGRAMQLTNIVRDVGEDLQQNRIYLPADLLDRHGVSTEDLRAMARGEAITPEYRTVLKTVMARAEEAYTYAFDGLVALPGPFGRASAVASEVYRGIHRDLVNHRFDNFSRRARTNGTTKIVLACQALVRLEGLRTSNLIRHEWIARKETVLGFLRGPIFALLALGLSLNLFIQVAASDYPSDRPASATDEILMESNLPHPPRAMPAMTQTYVR